MRNVTDVLIGRRDVDETVEEVCERAGVETKDPEPIRKRGSKLRLERHCIESVSHVMGTRRLARLVRLVSGFPRGAVCLTGSAMRGAIGEVGVSTCMSGSMSSRSNDWSACPYGGTG